MNSAVLSKLRSSELGSEWRAAFTDLAVFRLKKIARALLARERPNHTLAPTALVAEAFLRLSRHGKSLAGEEHFFRAAACVMSRVLLDYGRAHRLRRKVPIEDVHEALLGAAPLGELNAGVRLALEKLKRLDPLAAETIQLRVVEGWTLAEVSRRQGRDAWRVRADCDYGLEWLAEALGKPGH